MGELREAPVPVPSSPGERSSAAEAARHRRSGGHRGPAGTTIVLVLLTAQTVALLLVGTYARATPRWWGFPFFYWYTLLWLGIGALSMAGCAALMRERDQKPVQKLEEKLEEKPEEKSEEKPEREGHG